MLSFHRASRGSKPLEKKKRSHYMWRNEDFRCKESSIKETLGVVTHISNTGK